MKFFSQSFIPAFFVYWKQYFFIPSSILLMEDITEIWGSQISKTNHIAEVEAMLPYCKTVFFNFLSSQFKRIFCLRNFLPFFVRAILPLLEVISVINRQQQFFLLVETSISSKSFILPSGNGFFCEWKPFLLLGGFSSQWKPSLKLVETICKTRSMF